MKTWASFILCSKHNIPEDTSYPLSLQDFVAFLMEDRTIFCIIIFMLNHPIRNEVTSGNHLFRVNTSEKLIKKVVNVVS